MQDISTKHLRLFKSYVMHFCFKIKDINFSYFLVDTLGNSTIDFATGSSKVMSKHVTILQVAEAKSDRCKNETHCHRDDDDDDVDQGPYLEKLRDVINSVARFPDDEPNAVST